MQEKTRTEYSILNILTGIGGYALNTILGFVCRIVFVHFLSAEYLGINGLFTNVIGVLSLAELGFGSAVVYALYKPLAEHDTKKIASLVQLYGKVYRIIGVIVGVIGLLLLPFITKIIGTVPTIKESIYLLYGINLFNTASTYFFSYKSSLIVAAQQNYLVAGINYIVTITQSVLQMIYLWAFHDYLGYLIIQSIGTLLYNIIISKLASKKFPYINDKDIEPLPKEEKSKLFRNVRDLAIYKISGLLVNSTDNILITFFKGLAITGIASNYTLLVNTIGGLLAQIFNGLTASIGNHNALSSSEEQHKMFNFMNLMNYWIFGWATLGIIFCSTDFVSLLFGTDYVLDFSIPLVLAINFYTVGMQNAVWTYKQTLGLFRYGRFLQIFTGIINIGLSILLGHLWGLFGILIATFFARLLTNLWYDPYVIFKHGFGISIKIYAKKYMAYLAVLLLNFVICYLLFEFINGNIWFNIVFHVLTVSLVFNLTFFVLFRRAEEFKKFKEVLLNAKRLVINKIHKKENDNG